MEQNIERSVQVIINYSLTHGRLTITGPIKDRPLMKMILTEAMDFVREMHPMKPVESRITTVAGDVLDFAPSDVKH